MTLKVSAVDARRTLGRLLSIVSLTHEDVIIERAGKSVARLTSCVERVAGVGREGKLDFRKSRGLGGDLWKQAGADAYIDRERGEWG